MNTFFTKFADV